MIEKLNLGENVSLVCHDENCFVYQMKDRSGEGMMTVHRVFPGVIVMYNDFHVDCCVSEFEAGEELFCIDHCREGRIEWEIEKNKYIYIEAGDMQMNTRREHTANFSFPLKHYHGITIAFQVAEAEQSLKGVLEGFAPDITLLRDKFCPAGAQFIMRAGASIEHIFSELYTVPKKTRNIYFKIKILELLLYLEALERPERSDERIYFYKAQVEKVKAIMELLSSNIEKRYTLAELSRRFDFPLTSMKNCFKAVYGESIYAYMKDYRMNAAAVMLQQSRASIAEIAGQVGYDNPSKFAAAFKSVMNQTPVAYRKSYVQMERFRPKRAEYLS